jgi:hypothetical protein
MGFRSAQSHVHLEDLGERRNPPGAGNGTGTHKCTWDSRQREGTVVPETSWDSGGTPDAQEQARVRRRRKQAGLARIARRMHDDEGMSYREIEGRLGISKSHLQRLVTKYARKRHSLESEAPQGAVKWAENEECPKCGGGMVLRRSEKGWFAGCWRYEGASSPGDNPGCRGTVTWTGPQHRQPEPDVEALMAVEAASDPADWTTLAA